MNEFDANLYERIDHSDGRVEFVPKKIRVLEKYPDPDLTKSTQSVFVGHNGDVIIHSKTPHKTEALVHHNLFHTKETAEKASKLMRRSNAIIRACLLVDPEFEPDWSDLEQNKFFPEYNHDCKKWFVDGYYYIEFTPAVVSTLDKCEEVCELLTVWGIK